MSEYAPGQLVNMLDSKGRPSQEVLRARMDHLEFDAAKLREQIKLADDYRLNKRLLRRQERLDAEMKELASRMIGRAVDYHGRPLESDGAVRVCVACRDEVANDDDPHGWCDWCRRKGSQSPFGDEGSTTSDLTEEILDD